MLFLTVEAGKVFPKCQSLVANIFIMVSYLLIQDDSPHTEKCEVAQTRIAGKHLRQCLCDTPGSRQRKRRFIGQSQQKSYPAHMRIERDNQVGRTHRRQIPKSTAESQTDHPAQKHVELLLRTSAGHPQKRTKLLHRISRKSQQGILQRTILRIHRIQLLEINTECRIRNHPVKAPLVPTTEIILPASGKHILQGSTSHQSIQFVYLAENHPAISETQDGSQQSHYFNIFLPDITVRELYGIIRDEIRLMIASAHSRNCRQSFSVIIKTHIKTTMRFTTETRLSCNESHRPIQNIYRQYARTSVEVIQESSDTFECFLLLSFYFDSEFNFSLSRSA